MESANLYDHHHHHHQQLQSPQLLYSSSSSQLGVSSTHDWNPSFILDGCEFNRYMTEILPNSSSSVKSPLLQEMRFGHVHPPANNNEVEFENIKLGSSISDNFLKLSHDMMNIHGSFNNSYGYIKNEHQDQDVVSWLSSAPKQKLSSSQSYLNGENFAASRLRPSCTEHNNLYTCSSLLSSSSPSLQLAEGSNQSFVERNSSSYFHVQQSIHSPSNSSNKKSKFRNEASRTEKHSACRVHEVVTKKPRLTSSSSSCPTLKVRKEKLGDRIAALHRLVSPFGKTDTASVLTEAIGYIHFLQDQIQTLTVSYLESSRGKSLRNITRDSRILKDDQQQHHEKEDEPRNYQELRSRGLCLVPLSFSSYICSYINGTF